MCIISWIDTRLIGSKLKSFISADSKILLLCLFAKTSTSVIQIIKSFVSFTGPAAEQCNVPFSCQDFGYCQEHWICSVLPTCIYAPYICNMRLDKLWMGWNVVLLLLQRLSKETRTGNVLDISHWNLHVLLASSIQVGRTSFLMFEAANYSRNI